MSRDCRNRNVVMSWCRRLTPDTPVVAVFPPPFDGQEGVREHVERILPPFGRTKATIVRKRTIAWIPGRALRTGEREGGIVVDAARKARREFELLAWRSRQVRGPVGQRSAKRARRNSAGQARHPGVECAVDLAEGIAEVAVRRGRRCCGGESRGGGRGAQHGLDQCSGARSTEDHVRFSD